MKKFWFLLAIIAASILMAALAFAQVGPIDPADLIDQGVKTFDAIATQSVSIGAGTAMILYFMTNVLKMRVDESGVTLADRIVPRRYRALVIAILGVVGGGAATILSGGTLPLAISVALSSGALPILLHEIYNSTFKKEE